jgi:thymidylate kinase
MPSGDFWVLLGPDYSGKSSVISAVADRTDWRVVSYDEKFLDDGLALVGRLRDNFMSEALRGAGERYSADFVLSILQAAVLFLRDQALSHGGDGPVVVDSYYYKILAKCQLSGLVNETIFEWWRSFPAPRGVIYLDTDPATAWRRAAGGAAVNGFEHYGDRPTWEAFDSFQRDLRRLMLVEVHDVPTWVVRPGPGVDEMARRVEDIVRSSHGNGVGDRVADIALPA